MIFVLRADWSISSRAPKVSRLLLLEAENLNFTKISLKISTSKTNIIFLIFDLKFHGAFSEG